MITIKSNNIFAVDIGGSKLICGFVTAGEIGHFIVEEANGEECGCGNFGCLEAMASGASISKIYNRATNQNLTTKEIAELAKTKNVTVISLTGFAGGKLKELADIDINIPSDSYEKVEDLHMIITHIIVCCFKAMNIEV